MVLGILLYFENIKLVFYFKIWVKKSVSEFVKKKIFLKINLCFFFEIFVLILFYSCFVR